MQPLNMQHTNRKRGDHVWPPLLLFAMYLVLSAVVLVVFVVAVSMTAWVMLTIVARLLLAFVLSGVFVVLPCRGTCYCTYQSIPVFVVEVAICRCCGQDDSCVLPSFCASECRDNRSEAEHGDERGENDRTKLLVHLLTHLSLYGICIDARRREIVLFLSKL